jgi:hypothetical protein
LSHELWLGLGFLRSFSLAELASQRARGRARGTSTREGVVVLGLGCPEVSGLSVTLSVTKTATIKNRWEMLR